MIWNISCYYVKIYVIAIIRANPFCRAKLWFKIFHCFKHERVHLIVYCCIHSSRKSTNNLKRWHYCRRWSVVEQAKGCWFCVHATKLTYTSVMLSKATFCLISFGDTKPCTLKVAKVSTKNLLIGGILMYKLCFSYIIWILKNYKIYRKYQLICYTIEQ